MRRVEFGEYVVSDPGICHGQLASRARIMVRVVLEYLAAGRDWGWVIHAYDDSFPKEAIAEALLLAARALGEPERAMKMAA